MKVTATPSKRSGLELTETDLTVAELSELLSTYDVREEKDGPALIPAAFHPCPSPCRNHGKPKATDCGGGQAHRLRDNVAEMTGLGIDVDDVTEERGAAVLDTITAKGLRAWYWQTHGHEPSANNGAGCRFRVLIPFKEPMPLVSAKQWSRGAWPALLKHLGLDGVVAKADPACSDPSRVYYLPSKPSEEAEREAHYFDGEPLDWRTVLGNSLDSFEKAAEVPIRPPEEDPSRPVDLAEVRSRLEVIASRRRSTPLLNVLAGRAPTPPPGKRGKGQPARYTAWRSVTQTVANQVQEWMATSALLELFRPAWDAEVKESPADHTEWSTVEHLFETARAEAARSRAEWQAKQEADRAMVLKAVRELRPRPEPTPTAEGDAEGGEPDQEADVPKAGASDATEDWLSAADLIWTADKEGNSKIAKDRRNLEQLIRLDPALANVRRNELSLNVEVQGDVFNAPEPVPLEKWHTTAVQLYILRTYNVEFATDAVWEYLLLVADLRRYDPLKDFLNGLKHDGTPRLHRLFLDYIRCAVPENGGEEYLETLAKRWLTGGVARGLSPGAKMDNILHLEGEQGIGKTTALDILGGRFYADTELNFDDKDAKMMCCRYWLMELAEGVSLNRSSREMRRAFLSRRVDAFRAPYAAGLEDHPRRCFLASTTNDTEYLDDVTGHRRDWVVRVLSVDTAALRRDREQLIAEAVALYRSGFEWHMTEAETAIAGEQAASRARGDAVAEKIEARLLAMEPGKRPEEFSTAFAIERLLDEQVGRGLEMRVANALKGLGFEKDRNQRVKAEGQRVRNWHTPERLLNAPKREGQPGMVERIAQQPKGIA